MIKVAVLGAGRMGKTVIGHLLKMPESPSVVVYDQDPAVLSSLKGESRISSASSLQEVLSDRAIGLVFITASNHAHKELAMAALQAGKSVMLEKPIATTFQESEQIIEAAEKLGAYLQIGFELRYSKLYANAKRWIDEGLIGKVVNFSGTYICSEFHGKGSWRNRRQFSGSMFGEKLSHYVDLQRWWSESEPYEVYAVSSPNVVPYFEVNDNYHVVSRFKNGAVGHLTFMMAIAESFGGDPLQNSVSQQTDDGHELRYLVVGTKGALETDVFRRRLRRWEFNCDDHGLHSKLVEANHWNEGEDHTYFHNTEGQTWDIVRRVHRGHPPATIARDALKTMSFCEAVQRSVDDGGVVLCG